MITSRSLKGFIFAFLCIFAGGFLVVGGSVQPVLSILLIAGAILILFGLLVGFFSVGL